MDTNIDNAETRVMTLEESLAAEKQAFGDLTSTSDITPEKLTEAWEIYASFTMVRKEKYLRDRQFKSKLPSSEEFANFLAQKRHAILTGKSEGFKDKDISAATSIFFLDTVGLNEVGGELGVLLENLKGDDLDKSKKFCKAMNKVGLKKGDITNISSEEK